MKFNLPLRIAIGLLSVMPIATGCGVRGESADTADTASVDTTDCYIKEITNLSDSLTRTLTLRQRAAQCVMPAVYSSSDGATLQLVRQYMDSLQVGGLLLLQGTREDARILTDSAVSVATVAPFIAIDAEWGLGMRLKDAPSYRQNRYLGADSRVDEDYLFDYGNDIAEQCRDIGINMIMGPVADVVRSGKSAIGSRSFGNNPQRVAELTVAYSRGLEDGGVISVVKHFPGHGNAEDSHKQLPVIDKPLEELLRVDIYPFKKYVDAQLSGVMVGHLSVPALGDSLPAAISKSVINKWLRGKLSFRGLVITDALNMAGVSGHTAAEAVQAGADIVLAPQSTSEAISSIVEGVRTGRIPESRLNDACRRILFYKYMKGIIR